MSEHALPPDPSMWPRDPYELLGVSRGVSSRDLRKAYLHLIRSYKPEHSPAEFQRIRAAYDAALPLAKHLEMMREAAEEDVPPEPDLLPEIPPEPAPHELDPSPKSHRPGPDPWDLACRGDSEAAYRALVDLPGRERPREETYLQLYWLLAIAPRLEPSRPALSWLVQGLGACGVGARRLRELLRREVAADPSSALGDQLASFFRRRSVPALALEVVELRWRAARDARRSALILADLHGLRAWMPESDEATWARTLLAASMNLAWAEKPDSDRAVEFAMEVERLGHRSRDYSDELYQVEYAQIVKQGLDRVGGRQGAFGGIFRLLSQSWDEPGPETRARLRSYVDQVFWDPVASLNCLDQLHGSAPAVVARLSTLLGGLDYEAFFFGGSGVYDDLAPSLDRFLRSSRWTDYTPLRPDLLRFCLRESASPGLVARTLSERPEFILTGKNPLALAIQDDLPLRNVYRACELAREQPGTD